MLVMVTKPYDFQGIGTSIARKPYIFVIFQGGGGGGVRPPLSPPLDLLMIKPVNRAISKVCTQLTATVPILMYFGQWGSNKVS